MSIEGTLFKSNFIGKDGFVWWIGKVAAPSTWFNKNQEKSFKGDDAFRCKVRIIGYHPFDNTLKEDDLPWATVLMDASNGNSIYGQSSQLKGGEACVGFFLDGEEGQQPVIVGLLHRNTNVQASITEEEFKKEQSTKFLNLPLDTTRILNRAETITTTVSPDPTANNSAAAPGKANALYCTKPAAANAFEQKMTQFCFKPSTCNDDFIGRITQILQDFIAGIAILEKGITGFVNPVLNKIVDVAGKIRSVASQIGGVVKLIINSIRSSIFKCISNLFRNFLGLNKKANPAHPVVNNLAKKATKNIFEKIYCLFENLIDEVIDFIINMLSGMVGKIVNPTACVAEQFTSAILAKLLDLIDSALQPILSGISWLTGGIGKVLDILGEVSTIAQEIFSFIGDCGSIKCTKPSKWISSISASLDVSTDNWKKQLNNINVLKGFSNDLDTISNAIGGDIQLEKVLNQTERQDGTFDVQYLTAGGNTFTRQEDGNGNPIVNGQPISKNQIEGLIGTVDTLTGGNASGSLGSLEGSIASMTLFGGFNSAYSQCNEATFNPKTQDELSPLSSGYKYNFCIPPIAEVVGTGIGASVIPIVGDNSGILSIEVINGGTGYQSKTPVVIIDNSGHGNSATAEAIVDGNGTIQNIVVLNSGFGYCPGDYTGIGTTGNPGIGTTSIAGISSAISGIVTDVYIPKPGIGYTPGDTVGIGSTSIKPILTPNGSIISVPIPNDFKERFTSIPIITINTKTGVGAKLKPIIKFVPQTNYSNKPTDPKIIIVKDCP
jgi:hypothetical protein